ncbi:hypothetical protein [Burkholderia perseverans]|uniref:hypothetical protein n=1 Tax=Burkholderia perseverans TaxID=2615214 RepID=UPI001FEFD6E0|nr:hypothetical protein [Burkholderia perseverans]
MRLTTQAGNTPGPQYQPPWDFNTVDTNTGVGGEYIYIGYQYGDSDPVTSLNFVAYDHAQSNPPSGWNWSSQDLKAGAGGKYIYMTWKNGEAGKKPITAIMLLVINSSSPPPIEGYISIHQDLNQGAGGPYIWPYYSTVVSMSAKEEQVIRKG